MIVNVLTTVSSLRQTDLATVTVLLMLHGFGNTPTAVTHVCRRHLMVDGMLVTPQFRKLMLVRLVRLANSSAGSAPKLSSAVDFLTASVSCRSCVAAKSAVGSLQGAAAASPPLCRYSAKTSCDHASDMLAIAAGSLQEFAELLTMKLPSYSLY